MGLHYTAVLRKERSVNFFPWEEIWMNIIKALKQSINKNSSILQRYSNLDEERRRIFIDDITIAMDERLRVLE